MPTRHLPFSVNERGGNLFRSDDGDLYFAHELTPGRWALAQFLGNNYPAFHVSTRDVTVEELVADIRRVCGGWSVLKNNLGVPTSQGRVLDLEE